MVGKSLTNLSCCLLFNLSCVILIHTVLDKFIVTSVYTLKKIIYIVAQASGGVSFYISLFNTVSLFAHEDAK